MLRRESAAVLAALPLRAAQDIASRRAQGCELGVSLPELSFARAPLGARRRVLLGDPCVLVARRGVLPMQSIERGGVHLARRVTMRAAPGDERGHVAPQRVVFRARRAVRTLERRHRADALAETHLLK